MTTTTRTYAVPTGTIRKIEEYLKKEGIGFLQIIHRPGYGYFCIRKSDRELSLGFSYTSFKLKMMHQYFLELFEK